MNFSFGSLQYALVMFLFRIKFIGEIGEKRFGKHMIVCQSSDNFWYVKLCNQLIFIVRDRTKQQNGSKRKVLGISQGKECAALLFETLQCIN